MNSLSPITRIRRSSLSSGVSCGGGGYSRRLGGSGAATTRKSLSLLLPLMLPASAGPRRGSVAHASLKARTSADSSTSDVSRGAAGIRTGWRGRPSSPRKYLRINGAQAGLGLGWDNIGARRFLVTRSAYCQLPRDIDRLAHSEQGRVLLCPCRVGNDEHAARTESAQKTFPSLLHARSADRRHTDEEQLTCKGG